MVKSEINTLKNVECSLVKSFSYKVVESLAEHLACSLKILRKRQSAQIYRKDGSPNLLSLD